MSKTPLQTLSEKYPAIKELAKRFDLIPVSPSKTKETLNDNVKTVTTKKSNPK